MAEIRSYRREKETREKQETGYIDKIRRHKLTSAYRTLLILACLAALGALIYVQYRRHVYTDYEVVSSVSLENASGATNVRLGSSVLTYSKDGAHCTDAKGNVTWNQTYEMQDIIIDVSGSAVAIGDYNGRSIYVQTAEAQLGEITTNMPIRDFAVAEDGTVTAVLADTDITWLNTYSADGTLLYQGQTRMDDSGYPCAISLSPSGELLCASYVYVDAGVLKTNIVFYNFGPVGENNSDYIVSAYSYTDLLVPYVAFLDDNTAVAVGDSRLMMYTGAHQPTLACEYLFDEEIQAVYTGEGYVGLVFDSEEQESLYRLDVYNSSANGVGSFEIAIDFMDLFFEEECFVAYNETECQIVTMAGAEKFSGNFKEAISLMLPTSGAYRYMVVSGDKMETIQLK